MVENNVRFGQGLTYHDSRFASPRELVSSLTPFDIHTMQGCAGGPVLYRNGNIAFSDPSDLHSLIVGDTGSTKTLRFVRPLIRSCAAAGESMVITDPKGTLYEESEKFLHRNEYDIHVLNFRKPAMSLDGWNPLFTVIDAIKNKKDKSLAFEHLSDAFDQMFIQRIIKGVDPYWNESASIFAMGICQMMIESGRVNELSMSRVIRWRNHLNELKEQCLHLPGSSAAFINLMSVFRLEAEKTKSCIFSTFDQLTRLFNTSPALTEMLNKQTFNLSDVGKKKTAIFLVIPDEKTTLHFLVQLFNSQCYTSLIEAADDTHGKLPVRVNFILEEFCNLPKFSDIISMLTAARSRNIRLHLVIQSYSQLMAKYSDNEARAILDNAGNWIYLHSRDNEFLKYMAEIVGKDEMGHYLLSSSKLQHLERNETLILHDRCYPIVVKDVPLIFEYEKSDESASAQRRAS